MKIPVDGLDALRSVGDDIVAIGNGENSISDAARAKVESALAGPIALRTSFGGVTSGEVVKKAVEQYLAARNAAHSAAEEGDTYVKSGSYFSTLDNLPDFVAAALSSLHAQPEGHQQRVAAWMQECFGPEITADKVERVDRFIEEALELAQATGWTADRARALVDYVFGRPVGEIGQEVGGVMVTLAALCNVFDIDMNAEAKREVDRITQPEIVLKIRAKQAAKPTGSALPVALSQGTGSREAVAVVYGIYLTDGRFMDIASDIEQDAVAMAEAHYEASDYTVIPLVPLSQLQAVERERDEAREAVVPQFDGVAKRKLDDLVERGWEISGYAIRKDGDHGLVTVGGFVGWFSVAERNAASAEASLAAAREALTNIRELNLTGEDENGHKWANSDLIEQEIRATLAGSSG